MFGTAPLTVPISRPPARIPPAGDSSRRTIERTATFLRLSPCWNQSRRKERGRWFVAASQVLARHAALALLGSFAAATGAMAGSGEANCTLADGKSDAWICSGSDHTGIRFMPEDGLDLTVRGGADKAGTTTIIGQGLPVRLPNGQHIQVEGHGISVESAGTSAISVMLEGHARVYTHGAFGHGINVIQDRFGPLDIQVAGGPIVTGGQGSHGVNAEHRGEGDISIAVERGADITARREGSNAIQGFQYRDGSVNVLVEKGAIVRGAPGAGRGVAAFLTNDRNSGRIVIDNRGMIVGGALTDGILAWAHRHSGHVGYTREDGRRQGPAEVSNDGARDEPLIHIVSNGTIRVGDPASVGLPGQPPPEALAVTINLNTVNGLLSPPLPPVGAGIRAYAGDLVGLLNHVAVPKILAPAELSRLAEQLGIPGLTPELLAVGLGAVDPQGNPLPVNILSLAEAGVIREILDDTGEDRLKEELKKLTLATSPHYTEAYKNRIREFEMSYNAGDILIEVTGGSITSLDGFGIHAGYPIPGSKRNGRVSVSVSQGAVVTGATDGIRLATGGIADNRRQQFVHVAGHVTGQRGAGVHPVAGGEVTVARTGHVSGRTGIQFSGGTGNGDFPVTDNVAKVFGAVGSTGPGIESATNPLTGEEISIRHAGIKLEGGGNGHCGSARASHGEIGSSDPRRAMGCAAPTRRPMSWW